ncbi:serine/threonine-protein kinase rio1 [Culex quinquefasciatus]|uniref:non-specific serine/threonine protein kinase n=2 Tax=Culex pipiens complex TaxID=518105 RepID=B0WZE2_CULQU|nr:serine/threonine-protein kinase rio1 [Culex quinquefasciatus]|eukprot:XP_001862764.1 serine/threonine-protein kinase rio1 [Culex quinquefasciatus]
MVRTWAEKEMRNLVRMKKCNLPVPEPILLRSHVLVMEFIGKDGWPAPKLKDVELSGSKARELYRDAVEMMWTMYSKCKLVHADLSEFNLLYHEGKIVIIDVSQSVEHEHPHALEFLRKDCTNITDFFRKKDVSTMTVKELFDFITDPTITEENMEECLEKMSEKIANRSFDEFTEQQKLEEAVFKQIFIPKTLHDVYDIERDIFGKTNKDELVYKTITGLDANLQVAENPEILQNGLASGELIPDARLIGGTNAVWGQFPATVSINTPFHLHCGGVILHPSHVLTSAQCVLNNQNRLIDPYWLTIVAGDVALAPVGARRQTRRVSQIFVHPEFNVFTREHDLAVLRLDRPFETPSNTLDWARRRTRVTPPGEQCQFAGWGAASNAANAPVNVLQRFLPMNINDRDLCNQATMHAGRVRDGMICAGNTAASNNAAPCNGNLGTGLFCNRELVGILSFGVNCGVANNPPVFTQVRNYNRWIDQQFGRTDGLPPNWTPGHL